MGPAAVATAVTCMNFRRLNFALWLIRQKSLQPKDHPREGGMHQLDEMSVKLSVEAWSIRNFRLKRSFDTKAVDKRVKEEYPWYLSRIAPSPW
jgi:hypothetical protein